MASFYENKLHLHWKLSMTSLSIKRWLRASLMTAGLVAANMTFAVEGLNKPHIQVRGAANVELAPDALRMTVRINELQKDVAEAKNIIESRTKQFVDALKKLGVEGRDITTQPLSIRPEIDYGKTPREVLGTNVSRTVTVVLRDLKRYSELSAAIVDAKITETQASEFFLTNEDELRNQVQLAAIKDARKRAEALAAAEGRKIVGLWSADATFGGGSTRFEMMADMAPQAAMLKTSRAPANDVFESGTLRVDGEITAIYLLD
jgi:uncharacterized protein YggE